MWLARDCIRASLLEEAEDFLTRYGREHARDYRTACGFGFVHLERGSYTRAADFFTEALGSRITPVQKTYLLLLLSRIYTYIGDEDRALAALKEALRTEPYCLEARFEEIVRYFQRGQPSDAMSRLLKLLRFAREYWAAALISPELTKFQSSIAPEFRKIAIEAGKEAQAASREADRTVASLKGFLRDDDEGVAEIVSAQKRVHELLEKPSALPACQDAVHTAKRIVADCEAIEKERKEAAAKALLKLEARGATLLRDGAGAAKLIPLVRSILERLGALVEGLERREPIDRCLEQCEALSREFEPIEAAAIRLKARAEIFPDVGKRFQGLVRRPFDHRRCRAGSFSRHGHSASTPFIRVRAWRSLPGSCWLRRPFSLSGACLPRCSRSGMPLSSRRGHGRRSKRRAGAEPAIELTIPLLKRR